MISSNTYIIHHGPGNTQHSVQVEVVHQVTHLVVETSCRCSPPSWQGQSVSAPSEDICIVGDGKLNGFMIIRYFFKYEI